MPPTTRKPAARRTAPQDHKPKAEKPKVTKIDGGRQVEFKGITVKVMDEALDDFELMDAMAQAEEQNDPSKLPRVLRGFVGESGYRAVMDGLRNKDGKVSITDATAWLYEMMSALNPN